MTVLSRLKNRGFIDQITDPKLEQLLETPLSFYWGIDPTASAPHLGNYVGFMLLSHLAKAGHRPVILIGGATALVGDPSGKDLERPMLSREEVKANRESLEKVLRGILARSAPGAEPCFVDNSDWYGNMNVLAFLRDVGKSFRLGPMLAKESVRARVSSEEGMSFTEFSYQLLQGYDFLHLFRAHQVKLQIGGSDQWGNITAGSEYARKTDGVELYGLTSPLLTRSDGKKFGKSEGGAIWLSAELCSPYQFYQYLLRVPDQDVIHLLKILTFLEIEEIHELEESMKKPSYEPNTLQRLLAKEVTAIVHGMEGVDKAIRATEAANSFNPDLLDAVLEELPHKQMDKSVVENRLLIDLFVESGFLPSKGEAKRLIKNQGAYLNGEKVLDEQKVVAASDILQGNKVVLGSGKKKKLLLLLREG
jgi:tyrosyl-tRNA synthetase